MIGDSPSNVGVDSWISRACPEYTWYNELTDPGTHQGSQIFKSHDFLGKGNHFFASSRGCAWANGGFSSLSWGRWLLYGYGVEVRKSMILLPFHLAANIVALCTSTATHKSLQKSNIHTVEVSGEMGGGPRSRWFLHHWHCIFPQSLAFEGWQSQVAGLKVAMGQYKPTNKGVNGYVPK